MRQEHMKQQNRYYLRKRPGMRSVLFYHESGTQHVGTPDEKDYINWTRYKIEAKGFRTMKEARNMANLLWAKYGHRVDVVNQHGEVV